MNAAPEIKGWCPGALRPMQSGDGLLVRAKTIGPRLTAEEAQEIAAISASCGNGLIDLSQRGQLQLRGVTETTLEAALQRLSRLGLLARDAATESILNFIVSPLIGFEAGALIDARDLLARLSHALTADLSLQALPGKFGFLIDDGGALGLADAATDIRLEACEEKGAARIAVVAEGARERAFIVPVERAVEAAIALARTFLCLRKGRQFELRRMRSLVEAFGVDAVAREAGLEMRPYRSTCHRATSSQIFGARTSAQCRFAGIGAPFGRWRAGDIALLSALAAQDGIGELRLTPWRAILLPCQSEDAARKMAQAAACRGLIVKASDARLAVVACPGAPDCPQARGETRATAERLAPLARRLTSDGVALHISGCAKGCTMPAPAKVALLASGAGFDLIDNGRACDPPSLRGLSLDEIKDALIARMMTE
ncbi:MAG: precorrin-3B synthase [Methylocystis sp.]|nr:precorrin-3B synthase [Methylocystis sp.]